MEVLRGRLAINPSLPREKVNIEKSEIHWKRRGMLGQIIYHHLVNTINPNSLRMFGETVENYFDD